MPEGTPADLDTLWGSDLMSAPALACPSPCPPGLCSTLMPKALPRRHEVSL